MAAKKALLADAIVPLYSALGRSHTCRTILIPTNNDADSLGRVQRRDTLR